MQTDSSSVQLQNQIDFNKFIKILLKNKKKKILQAVQELKQQQIKFSNEETQELFDILIEKELYQDQFEIFMNDQNIMYQIFDICTFDDPEWIQSKVDYCLQHECFHFMNYFCKLIKIRINNINDVGNLILEHFYYQSYDNLLNQLLDQGFEPDESVIRCVVNSYILNYYPVIRQNIEIICSRLEHVLLIVEDEIMYQLKSQDEMFNHLQNQNNIIQIREHSIDENGNETSRQLKPDKRYKRILSLLQPLQKKRKEQLDQIYGLYSDVNSIISLY
jgi:hypothetical protein